MTSTVLVTGASQGIGRATVQLLARQGYQFVLAARSTDRLETFAQELKDQGHQAISVTADVRSEEQVEHLIKTALDHYGSVDILVNNAGIYSSGPVEAFSLADWHQVLDTNLWGYIHTIHALLPHFLQRGSGKIINVSSIGGKVAIPYLSPYVTSKFAIAGLTQSLRSELAPKGIQVSGIYPNLIKSDFLERAVFRGKDAEDAQSREKQIEQLFKVPAIEKPEDVAKAILKAVQHNPAEILVGSAGLANATSHLFPDLMQWLFRKTFKQQDR